MKKVFSAAYKVASKELAREMSHQLTRNALSDGWASEVAKDLNVSYNDGVFETSHNPEHSTQMFDMEYGTQDSSPKGTIRKMYSSKKELSDRFATLLERAVTK